MPGDANAVRRLAYAALKYISHAKFAAKYKLPFTLLSDPERKAMAAYGAWGEKVLYGKPMTGIIRSTVIIGAGIATTGSSISPGAAIGGAAHAASIAAAASASAPSSCTRLKRRSTFLSFVSCGSAAASAVAAPSRG